MKTLYLIAIVLLNAPADEQELMIAGLYDADPALAVEVLDVVDELVLSSWTPAYCGFNSYNGALHVFSEGGGCILLIIAPSCTIVSTPSCDTIITINADGESAPKGSQGADQAFAADALHDYTLGGHSDIYLETLADGGITAEDDWETPVALRDADDLELLVAVVAYEYGTETAYLMLLDMEFSPDEAELATIGMLGLWGDQMSGMLDVMIVDSGGGSD